MMASLAEHVPLPVSTNTRGRLSVGSALPFGSPALNPWLVEWNGVGVMVPPLIGSSFGCLALN